MPFLCLANSYIFAAGGDLKKEDFDVNAALLFIEHTDGHKTEKKQVLAKFQELGFNIVQIHSASNVHGNEMFYNNLKAKDAKLLISYTYIIPQNAISIVDYILDDKGTPQAGRAMTFGVGYKKLEKAIKKLKATAGADFNKGPYDKTLLGKNLVKDDKALKTIERLTVRSDISEKMLSKEAFPKEIFKSKISYTQADAKEYGYYSYVNGVVQRKLEKHAPGKQIYNFLVSNDKMKSDGAKYRLRIRVITKDYVYTKTKLVKPAFGHGVERWETDSDEKLVDRFIIYFEDLNTGTLHIFNDEPIALSKALNGFLKMAKE